MESQQVNACHSQGPWGSAVMRYCGIPSGRRTGITLHGHRGTFQVYPVEYKRGSPKDTEDRYFPAYSAGHVSGGDAFLSDREGAVFYGEINRRDRMEFSEEFKEQVRNQFSEMHQYFDRRYTPKVKWSKSCNACSLKDICLPKLGKAASVKGYIKAAIAEDCR